MAAGRKTGGRQKGTPNRATADIKALARKYTAEALGTLAEVMRDSESDAARVAAVKELLDRGYGKARQPITGEDEGSAVAVLNRIELVGVRPGDDRPA